MMTLNLFGYSWNVDGPWGAPGGGTFQPENVFTVDGMLILKLEQIVDISGVISNDAEVISRDKFGYGTFEFVAAVEPVESGQVASGFLFYNNSETEIDVELTGELPDAVWFTNYAGIQHKQYSEVNGFLQSAFRRYKIVWQPGQIEFFVDGALLATHTQDVPSAPACFLFNFWGTNSKYWGGVATPGIRHMFVTDFKYTAL